MTVELKNDLAIAGTLHSVDQYLNIKLTNTRVANEAKYPHMVSTYSCKVYALPCASYTVWQPFGSGITLVACASGGCGGCLWIWV